ADAKKVRLSGAEISYDAYDFTGDVAANLKPMKVTADLSSKDIVDVDAVLAKLPKKSGDGPKGIDALLNALPRSVSVPVAVDADVALALGGVVLNKQSFSGVKVDVKKSGAAISSDIAVSSIPGKGPLKVGADLKFGDVSTSSSGAQVYSDPALDFTVTANVSNAGGAAAAFSGKGDLPVISKAKVGKFYVKGRGTPGFWSVSDAIVNLDDLKYQASGSVRAADNGKADLRLGVFGADIRVLADKAALFAKPFSLSVKHKSLAGLMSAAGVAAPDMPELRKALDFKGDIVMGNGTTKVSNIDAKLLGSALSGAVSVNGAGAKPVVNGDLKFGDLKIAPLDQKKNAGNAGNAGAAINTDFLRSANVDMKVAASSLTYDRWVLDQPRFGVKIQNGVLDLQGLQAGAFGGAIAMSARASAVDAAAPLSFSAKSDITNIQIGKLVAALSGNTRFKADGVVNFSYDVNSIGKSGAALKKALGGTASLNGTNVVLHGFDLLAVSNAVERDNRENILAAVKSFNGGSTAFDTVKGDYTIAKGVVDITSMAIDGAAASIVSRGAVDLPAGTMNTEHTVSFNQTDKLDPYTFSIRGPLNKPISSFANIGQDLLRTQAGKFVQEKAQELLQDTDIGKKLQQFGILPGASEGADDGAANDNAAPSAPAVDPAQKAIEGVLKGLF
ncbi:MAG: AsmA-like C-terminal region-containing protein, partial [Alphaproteobacteria bacterium]